mmetsp:Transcript_109/g.216  ORF Transcript_109/g.216 Transcript_109/m.216 type:complete len:220 (-) Transcript_109:56-715(-)
MVEIVKEKQAEFVGRRQRAEALDRKRKHQLKKTKEKELATKRGVLSKIEQEDALLKELADRRRKEQVFLKTEKLLRQQTKKENLERMKKAQEYQLKMMMQKAEANDRRCQDLKKHKEDLGKVRRKNAHEAKVKKDRLLTVLEQAKSASTGSAGIKKLLKSVSANAGLPRERMEEDCVDSLGPPPPFANRVGDKEHSPPYKSPCVTDDSFGIGNISIHDN